MSGRPQIPPPRPTSRSRNDMRLLLPFAIFSILLLVGLAPQTYIPERLAPVLATKATFDGKPVRLAVPNSRKNDVPGVFRIKMDRGSCRATVVKGTEPKFLFSMGEGNCRARLPAGGQLVLDPQGNSGEYQLTLGPEWHLLGPKSRRFVLIPMAFSVLLCSLFAGRLHPHVARIGGKRVLFLAVAAAISGAVLYPIVHEGGHIVFGMLFGATPDWHAVVWTSFGGEEPHASFAHLPEGAGPFMSAGGPILPTLFALVLLLVWRFVRQKAPWAVSATLVLVPVLFLFSTLGCLFELYGNSHMDALAVHLGLTGPLRVAFSLSPLLLALACYAWIAMTFRRSRLATSHES